MSAASQAWTQAKIGVDTPISTPRVHAFRVPKQGCPRVIPAIRGQSVDIENAEDFSDVHAVHTLFPINSEGVDNIWKYRKFAVDTVDRVASL